MTDILSGVFTGIEIIALGLDYWFFIAITAAINELFKTDLE